VLTLTPKSTQSVWVFSHKTIDVTNVYKRFYLKKIFKRIFNVFYSLKVFFNKKKSLKLIS